MTTQTKCKKTYQREENQEMPGFAQHLNAGAITGGVVGVVYSIAKQSDEMKRNPGQQFDLRRVLKSGLMGVGIGAVASTLPDILEPASSPHHRQLFHSVTVLVTIIIGAVKAGKSGVDEDLKQVIYFACAGYVSHLVGDSQTPMGIKVI